MKPIAASDSSGSGTMTFNHQNYERQLYPKQNGQNYWPDGWKLAQGRHGQIAQSLRQSRRQNQNVITQVRYAA
jgi:basic membrane lipoprotein Med (substrate-binding protein (PBP1-ABC) superfamily)